jgi:lipoyl synthase
MTGPRKEEAGDRAHRRPTPGRKPAWLKVRPPAPGRYRATGAVLDELALHTVCSEARCPNKGECFAAGTATFLILGDICTRSCRFCAVGRTNDNAGPGAPQAGEPRRLAEAAARLGLQHVVVTSVTRDDLPDGGAGHFAATIAALRVRLPRATVEVLIPDLGGDEAALRAVLAARPDVLSHNLETVPRLYTEVRPQADYGRSLGVVRLAATWARSEGRALVKAGLMVGLGETPDEVAGVLTDSAAAGADLVTIGQYLRPDDSCLPVARFVEPHEFAALARRGAELNLRVAAAPLVRSSYRAGELLERAVAALGEAARLPTPEVVIFDLDYTLLRPSDQFEAVGYQRTGARFGLCLDPRRWPDAERAALAAIRERRRHNGDAYDDGQLEAIARAVIQGLGGGAAQAVSATAEAISAAWSRAENFALYRDVRPCLDRLRAAGVRMVVLSNAVGHSLEEMVAHFALDGYFEALFSSATLGFMKPAPEAFLMVLERLGVAPGAAVMIGDSADDDVRGALAVGCGGILLDRAGRRTDRSLPCIESLSELPAALGL